MSECSESNRPLAHAKSLLAKGEISQAVQAYTTLIGQMPNSHLAYVGLGVSLTLGKRYAEAQMVFEEALTAWPENAEVIFGLASMLQQEGRLEKAAAIYRHNLALHPNHLMSAHNLGVVLYAQTKFVDAAQQHAQNLQLYPEHIPSWRDFGQSLIAAGKLEEGFDILAEAHRRWPKDRETEFAMGLAALSLGKWQIGWKSYEARWLPGELEARIPPECHYWDGQPIPSGATLHILSEQGFGDNLLFSRYLPFLNKLAKRITYVSHPTLATLFQSSFPSLQIRTACAASKGDVFAPIASLPRLLLETLPTPPKLIPYLSPAKVNCTDALLHFVENLPASFIGITWRGSQKISLDRRSSSLQAVLEHVSVEQSQHPLIVSFQKEPTDLEIQQMEQFGILDLSPVLTDFNATALILSRADYLISVDTAIVHLAGAIGVPVRLLLNQSGDWRWGKEPTLNAWYPRINITQSLPKTHY